MRVDVIHGERPGEESEVNVKRHKARWLRWASNFAIRRVILFPNQGETRALACVIVVVRGLQPTRLNQTPRGDRFKLLAKILVFNAQELCC